MFRWAELAFRSSRAHLPFLREFLQEYGVENELQLVETTPETWVQDLEVLKHQVDHIRLGRELAEIVQEQHLSQDYLGQKLGWAECLVHLGSNWWPKTFLDEALMFELSQLKTNIDFTKKALIIGANGMGVIALAVMARYGYRRIRVVDPDAARGKAFVEKYKQVFFHLELNYASIDAITTASADSTLVINCMVSGQNEPFVNDLCYFNYLVEDGLVVEMNVFPVETSLVREARKVGVRVIPGHMIWGRSDMLWIKEALGKCLRAKEYQIRLRLICARSTSA